MGERDYLGSHLQRDVMRHGWEGNKQGVDVGRSQRLGGSHHICLQEAESEPEVGLAYRASTLIPSDP